MGSWIVVGIQIALSVVTLAVAVLALVWARGASQDGSAVRKVVEDLLAAFQRGHGNGYPSAAAVVTAPREATPPPEALPDPDPAPALARAALPPQSAARDLARLRLVAPDELHAAREAWAGARAKQEERPGLDGDDRETPEEDPPPVSGGRGVTVERLSLDEEELAHIDEIAAQRGMTRDEMISVLLQSGFTTRERPRK